MLLGTLEASLLGNFLVGKGILRAGSGLPSSSTSYENKKGKGIVRAGSEKKKKENNRIFNTPSSFHKF